MRPILYIYKHDQNLLINSNKTKRPLNNTGSLSSTSLPREITSYSLSFVFSLSKYENINHSPYLVQWDLISTSNRTSNHCHQWGLCSKELLCVYARLHPLGLIQPDHLSLAVRPTLSLLPSSWIYASLPCLHYYFTTCFSIHGFCLSADVPLVKFSAPTSMSYTCLFTNICWLSTWWSTSGSMSLN